MKKWFFPTFLLPLGISIFIFVVLAPEFVLNSEELLYPREFKFLRTVFTHASVEFVFSKLLLVLQGHRRSRTCRPVIFHFLFLLPFAVVVFVLFRPSTGYSYNNLRNLNMDTNATATVVEALASRYVCGLGGGLSGANQ